MKKRMQITVSGFLSGETDFATLMQRRPEVAESEAMSLLIDAIVELRSTAAAGGASCLLTIIGHADRDMTPGKSEDDRRANEATNGLARANSADAFVQAAVAAREGVMGLNAGAPYPGDHFYINANSLGALAVVVPPGSEENSRRNRRVEFRFVSTNVNGVPDGDKSFQFD